VEEKARYFAAVDALCGRTRDPYISNESRQSGDPAISIEHEPLRSRVLAQVQKMPSLNEH